MNQRLDLPLNPDARWTLPPQPITVDVLREKYLKGDETSEADVFERVARALASVEAPAQRAHFEALFRRNLEAGAIGAGRIMSAAGTAIQATLINCFVQPVGDCIQGQDDAGFPGIYEALREAAETMRRGGGVGYDFSRIRPRGAYVQGTASTASGPCSYINVFDQSCATVESAGARHALLSPKVASTGAIGLAVDKNQSTLWAPESNERSFVSFDVAHCMKVQAGWPENCRNSCDCGERAWSIAAMMWR